MKEHSIPAAPDPNEWHMQAAQTQLTEKQEIPMASPDAEPISSCFKRMSLHGQDSLTSGRIEARLQSGSSGAWASRIGLNRRMLALALAYMESHVTEPSTLDDLAKAVGMSRSHFCRMFRLSTGNSPMGHWTRLRVELAKSMLLQGDRSACEIAQELGFFDQSHFSRTFRRIAGMSPRQFARIADFAEAMY